LASPTVSSRGCTPFPASDEYPLNNPLSQLFRKACTLFERQEDELGLSSRELESGEYTAANLDGFVEAAQTAVAVDPRSYSEALMAQDPETLDIVEWTKVSADDWFAFSLIMRNTIVEMVNRLNTR